MIKRDFFQYYLILSNIYPFRLVSLSLSVGWYLCANDTVLYSACGGFETGATAGPCLRSLWQRSQHGVLPREKAAAGARLGSGLLPHQVS